MSFPGRLVEFLPSAVQLKSEVEFVNLSNLEEISVVLCRAEEAGNVGSACRAMKTMGFTRLLLADCRAYDEDRLRTMAVHAFDLYEKAERFSDLGAALAQTSLSAGFTRRRGERRKRFSYSLRDFAARVAERRDAAIALVFGNERSGLSEAELSLCSLAVHIPSSEACPSLNLAQAVQLACYECRLAALEGRDGSVQPPTRSVVEQSVSRMAADLRSLGFFKIAGGRRLEEFLRDTAERAGYTPGELRYFESILRKAAALARRGAPPNG